jgi:hypothetical protein
VNSNSIIGTLMREIEDLKLQKSRVEEEYRKEIKSLQERGNAKTNDSLSPEY